jgi:exodeoxyribonuclease V gamma subunit
MWLRGAHDAQQLLASQGASANILPPPVASKPSNLLEALQESVRFGTVPEFTYVETDRSVQMHRAHNLGRQIEIVHEALIHAFNDDNTLEPHDVVVICADIETAAPLLDATFGRTVKSTQGQYKLPLVVADRGLRFVDDGAALLSSILTTVRGRFSISDVMAVATSPLVLQNFSANNDDVDAWNRIIERTRIRWGANQQHRARMNVDIHEDAHTWSAGLRRALAGALLPDSPVQADFGDVVPLADIEASDIDTVATLSRIVTVLVQLEEAKNTNASYNIIQWADAVDQALTALGVDSRGQLDNAREVINKLRGYVTAAVGDGVEVVSCSFNDFADLLEELIAGTPGRQPLRTGAITATSMVPLRSVPFKVVCLVGFDEGTMRAGEAEGDDLVSRQDFVGDSNARIDQRRAILDAIVAASSRVIITCNGRSIRDNTEVPLITPLSELLDLCERCGVDKRDNEGNHLQVEYQHPRHFGSATNYEIGEIVPGLVWSHDVVGLAALGSKKALTEAQQKALDVEQTLKTKPTASEELLISPRDFLRFIDDPLKTFVSFGLKISTWSDETEDEPALVPLTSRRDEQVTLCRSYIAALDADSNFDQWKKTQIHIGTLPFWSYGDEQAAKIQKFGDTYIDRRSAWGIALEPTTLSIDVPFKGGRVRGDIAVFLTDDNCIAIHEYQLGVFGTPGQSEMAHMLLLLLASGQHFDGGHILYRRQKEGDTFLQHVELDPDISASDAIDSVNALAELFVKATQSPFPLFGKAAEKLNSGEPEKALKEFRTRISRDTENADGDKFPYVSSRECLVFGLLPQFEDVFSKSVIDFFNLYFRVILSPNKERAEATGDKNIAPPHGGPKRTQRNVYV